jgi:hypothetical protein
VPAVMRSSTAGGLAFLTFTKNSIVMDDPFFNLVAAHYGSSVYCATWFHGSNRTSVSFIWWVLQSMGVMCTLSCCGHRCRPCPSGHMQSRRGVVQRQVLTRRKCSLHA